MNKTPYDGFPQKSFGEVGHLYLASIAHFSHFAHFRNFDALVKISAYEVVKFTTFKKIFL